MLYHQPHHRCDPVVSIGCLMGRSHASAFFSGAPCRWRTFLSRRQAYHPVRTRCMGACLHNSNAQRLAGAFGLFDGAGMGIPTLLLPVDRYRHRNQPDISVMWVVLGCPAACRLPSACTHPVSSYSGLCVSPLRSGHSRSESAAASCCQCPRWPVQHSVLREVRERAQFRHQSGSEMEFTLCIVEDTSLPSFR